MKLPERPLRRFGADHTAGRWGWLQGRESDTQHRMDAAMIATAREVWIGWRDRGSPALRATVVAELARTNQLAQFQGMTFDEWFAALQPGAATSRLFADGFESP